MQTIRIIRLPEKWESITVEKIKFTFGKDVGIVKGNYRATALNLAKAFLDVGYTVRVRHNVSKEIIINKKGNKETSVGTEIDFDKEAE